MKGGFSFCGVDIYDLGLEYAPENKDTYVYKSAPSKIQEQIFESMDGGYFFGVNIQPKDFTLRCYYEDKHIKNGLMTKIYNLFRVGRYGKLIFKDRDWCWYNATVTSVDATRMLNFKNGIIQITMKAYYPYATTDFYYLSRNILNRADILNNSAMLTDESMMPQMQFGSVKNPITDEMEILLYNPGTEPAKLSIEIAGDAGQGVSIINNTTNQECSFIAFNKEITTDANKYIVCDSLNGKTVITDGTNSELAFLYHDQGFIDLESAYPVDRKVKIHIDSGSNYFTTDYHFIYDVVGKYVYVNNKWYKITSSEDDKYFIDDYFEFDFDGISTVALLNRLTVFHKSNSDSEENMSLTRLNFAFIPTFA